VTIRTTLLAAFLGVGLLPAVVLTSLAFIQARQALQTEIERNMSAEAVAIATAIDKMMFERLQNAATWSRLDIMQDLQVRDVDKRLSRFLAGLQSGYRDVYLSLYCVDPQGNVVASSEAAEVGRAVTLPPPWLQTSLSGADLDIRLDDSHHTVGVLVQVPLASSFTAGTMGTLRLQLDWSEILTMLDSASNDGARSVAVLDRDGRIIAASRMLREHGLLLSNRLAAWSGHSAGVVERRGAPLLDADVLVGTATSKGYGQFGGFGWTTLIAQPVSQALAPVHRMAAIFAALLCVIVAAILIVATLISREIARPIAALTRLARGYMSSKILQAPPATGSGEVRELTEAFVQMVQDIDVSQQNLVRASKLAVVGEMSSVIAHEVRTPLGILRSSAQVLQREVGISIEGRELLGYIESETERLNRLVSAMLDTARPRNPAYTMVDLHALIKRSIAMLAAQSERKHVATTYRFAAADAHVECDEEQMTQVVLNLLLNGLQILHDGGRIEVATRNDGSNVVIEISDDGPGIDPGERSRIFDAFFFKREGGIGLGLAIVQQIVGAHAGSIEAVESPLGGAMFRIHLPRHRPQPT
jgi:two-component system sensor histidine kinase HydH